jgi:hypothetical protein
MTEKEEGVFEHHQQAEKYGPTSPFTRTDWTRRKRASPIDNHSVDHFVVSPNHLKTNSYMIS